MIGRARCAPEGARYPDKIGDGAGVAQVRIHGHEKRTVLGRDAVAREVEGRERCAVRGRAKLVERLAHGRQPDVLDELGLQPEGLEALGDVGRIAPHVGQLRFPLILGVADHQRDA